MQRRDFIKTSVVTAAALRVSPRTDAASAGPKSGKPRASWIDTNVTLFQWPFRRFPLDATDRLLKKMDQHGIVQAWAGSFEGILQRDIRSVNDRLAQECARHPGRFVPFGTINPTLPGWEADIQYCHEHHRMRGIRLHPNYHGYTLKDPRFAGLLALATERGLVVQLAVVLEDTRTHHPMTVAPDVDLAPLPDILAAILKARLVLLNSVNNTAKALTSPLFKRLFETSGVYYDISRVEGVAAVGNMMRQFPSDRVLFGTHAPFFIYESAVIKLYEADLSDAEIHAIATVNPQRVLEA